MRISAIHMRADGTNPIHDIDALAVHMHGFRVTHPSGEEQAAREAMYEHARASLASMRLRRFQMRPDGSLEEIN